MVKERVITEIRTNNKTVGVLWEKEKFLIGDEVVILTENEVEDLYGYVWDLQFEYRKENSALIGTYRIQTGYINEMKKNAKEKKVFKIKSITEKGYITLEDDGSKELIEGKSLKYSMYMLQHVKKKSEDFWENLEVL